MDMYEISLFTASLLTQRFSFLRLYSLYSEENVVATGTAAMSK